MRVLLLLAPNSDDAPLVGTLTSALAGIGVTAATSREINPDLDGYDLVHIIATTPIEQAIRQALHARRWGRPLVVTAVALLPTAARQATASPPERYERALWKLLVCSAARLVTLHTEGTASQGDASQPEGYVVQVPLRADSPEFGAALLRCYHAALEEYAVTMQQDDHAAARWIPSLSSEDYGRHLEDLVQLQLELIAYRDAEYAQLRQRLDTAQQTPHDQAFADEYARLGAWSRDLAARHEALQADYTRLQRWSGELESQLRGAARGGRLARIVNLLRGR